MIYPLRCEPIYKARVWGGRWFARHWGRILPDRWPYGESWELSYRPDAMSRISNGEWAGQELVEPVVRFPKEFLGNRFANQWLKAFPLLIKLLDVRDRLSIQVHPDENWVMRKRMEGPGKSEMWYVLDAEPRARLMVGFINGVTRANIVKALSTGQLPDLIHNFSVQKGDSVYIPAGTVHAIQGGVRLIEIQQNSDITYRLYDWERMDLNGAPRTLHVDDALDIINYTHGPISPSRGLVIEGSGWQCCLLVACPHFAVEEMRVRHLESWINPERFEIWVIFKGSGRLSAVSGAQDFQEGETWFIPAALGHYSLKGDLHFLKTYIPDLEGEIMQTLRIRGYSVDDLRRVGGLEKMHF